MQGGSEEDKLNNKPQTSKTDMYFNFECHDVLVYYIFPVIAIFKIIKKASAICLPNIERIWKIIIVRSYIMATWWKILICIKSAGWNNEKKINLMVFIKKRVQRNGCLKGLLLKMMALFASLNDDLVKQSKLWKKALIEKYSGGISKLNTWI